MKVLIDIPIPAHALEEVAATPVSKLKDIFQAGFDDMTKVYGASDHITVVEILREND